MKLQRLRKGLWMLLAVCTLLMGLWLPAGAAGEADPAREASLTLSFASEGRGYSGVEVRIYRVAGLSEAGEFTLEGDFAAYPVSLAGLDSDGWRAAARTLEGYALRDGLTPLAQGVTDESGTAAFSPLETGLYLVTGEVYTDGTIRLTPESFLVSLPNRAAGEEWTYNVTANCKFDLETLPPDTPDVPDTVERKVLKVWEDEGYESKRPQSIDVQLLKDGTVYDTVTLSQENDWRYSWTGLDAAAAWTVVEETPEGYTVSVTQEGITFVVTNTYETPDTPTTPTTPSTPSTPGGGGGSSGGGGKLPQTGMLWWPVPLLACGGTLLFLIGWGRRRRDEQ